MSTRRSFDLDKDFPIVQKPEENFRLQSWLRANTIDPYTVPQESHIYVTDDHIEYTSFQRGLDGSKTLDITTNGWAYVKEVRRVPLLTSPEDFQL